VLTASVKSPEEEPLASGRNVFIKGATGPRRVFLLVVLHRKEAALWTFEKVISGGRGLLTEGWEIKTESTDPERSGKGRK